MDWADRDLVDTIRATALTVSKLLGVISSSSISMPYSSSKKLTSSNKPSESTTSGSRSGAVPTRSAGSPSHSKPETRNWPILSSIEAMPASSHDGYDVVYLCVLPLASLAAPPRWTDSVSAEELQRAAQFHAVEARLLYLASHAALRSMLARLLDVPPLSVRFVRRCAWCGDPGHGRPQLANPHPRRVEFSLSRTRELAIVAVSREPVGVDVERVEPAFRVGAMRPVLAQQELETARLGGGLGARQLFQWWTAKEAVGKARGSGLVGVSAVQLAVAPSGGWQPIIDGDRTWYAWPIDVGPGHAASLVTARAAPSIRGPHLGSQSDGLQSGAFSRCVGTQSTQAPMRRDPDTEPGPGRH